MTSFRIRPRFQIVSPESEAELVQRLRQRVAEGECACRVSIIPGFIVLKIPADARHYWSPQLSLSLEETEEGTLIRGLYGPNPTIWAMFAFLYGAIGLLALFIGIVGLSAKSLGNPAPVLWALPVLGVAAVVLYVIAQTGQKLGAEQTFTLHHFFESTVGLKTPID